MHAKALALLLSAVSIAAAPVNNDAQPVVREAIWSVDPDYAKAHGLPLERRTTITEYSAAAANLFKRSGSIGRRSGECSVYHGGSVGATIHGLDVEVPADGSVQAIATPGNGFLDISVKKSSDDTALDELTFAVINRSECQAWIFFQNNLQLASIATVKGGSGGNELKGVHVAPRAQQCTVGNILNSGRRYGVLSILVRIPNHC